MDLTVGPDPGPCAEIGIVGEQLGGVVGIGLLEKLAQDCALVQRFTLVLQRGHKTSGVEVQQ